MKKVALIIGISTYQDQSLINATNDTRLVAQTLSSRGFSCKILEDPTGAEIDEALVLFGTEVQGRCFALVYLAGHGMEINGAGYVLPSDFPFPISASGVRQYAISIKDILNSMVNGGGPKVLILDACRSGFDTWNADEWTRLTPDLAMMRDTTNTDGVLIAYAASADEPALDGTSENGRYCEAFCEIVSRHSLSIEETFKEAGQAVITATKGRQRPWYYSTLSQVATFSDVPRFQLSQGLTIPVNPRYVPMSMLFSQTDAPALFVCNGSRNVYEVRGPSFQNWSVRERVVDISFIASVRLSRRHLVALDDDGGLHLWTEGQWQLFQTACTQPHGLDASSNGMVAIYDMHSIAVYDIRDDTLVCVRHVPIDWHAYCACFLDEDRVLFAGSSGTVVEISGLRGTPALRSVECPEKNAIYSATPCVHTPEFILTTHSGEILIYDRSSYNLSRVIALPSRVQTLNARRDSLLNTCSNEVVNAFLLGGEGLSDEVREFLRGGTGTEPSLIRGRVATLASFGDR